MKTRCANSERLVKAKMINEEPLSKVWTPLKNRSVKSGAVVSTWKNWLWGGGEGTTVPGRAESQLKHASLSETSCMKNVFIKRTFVIVNVCTDIMCKQKVCILKCTINVFRYNIVYSFFS